MDRRTFAVLCELFRGTGRLKIVGLVSIEEQVCMFLHILAHHVKNRTIHNRFQQSGETNCLGALDGTFMKIHVPEVDKPRFRSRKGEIATNVLGVCSRYIIFTFILPGWECSTSDSRVLRDALTRPTCLKVSTGKHHKHAEGSRGKNFPLYERLANIFGKDRATGKATQTPDQQATDFDKGDNFGNEFEIPENFSPMSMNQSQYDLNGNQVASQPSSRKRLRSKSEDSIASSMNRFSNMMKEAMEKTTETFKEFDQILAANKANEY
ncbi:hypothetical protein Ddye_013878 [Dipteronia dyeriana]|uniref:DUF8040 domain-containing protein n=1 Tax=Dipteronia dyeriana TaxID=168575 RepID=A0AAD9X774_9ROSI|nr:hypothetical protein Ddye_013878 [Dipteronia dyeriana]